MSSRRAQSECIGLRVTPSAKRMFQRAAAASNKTLTQFLLDAGLKAAFDTAADSRTLQLNKKRWNEFMHALDLPPKDNPGLRRLLVRKPVWEK